METAETLFPTIVERALERTKDMKTCKFESEDTIVFVSVNKNKTWNEIMEDPLFKILFSDVHSKTSYDQVFRKDKS